MRRLFHSVAAVVVTSMLLAGCGGGLTGSGISGSSDGNSLINGTSTVSMNGGTTTRGAEGNGPEFVANEVLIQLKAGVPEQVQDEVQRRVGAARRENVVAGAGRRDGKGDLVLAKLPPGLSVAAAKRDLEADSAVEFAEPNWIYQHQATSNDPYFTNGSLWGMYGDASSPANQYGSQAAEAWAAGNTGDPTGTVFVGIIDEGVMYSHTDLAANAGVNSGEIAGNGIDDDGNGYKDDVHGWDFASNDATTYDGTVDDHGTHVAGTIAGRGGNGIGVAGVCWNVKFLNAKFLGRNGGTTANAIKSVDYFTKLKTRATNPVNIVATNNSWGGGGFSQGLLDAIVRANAANILFVAAAGNGGSDGVGDNNDLVASYPSNYDSPNVVAVGALTSTGARASYSNYGATMVDLFAPGSAIYSTLPGKNNSSTYGSYSGTSMATPHVTGAAALYAASHAGATAAQIKQAIIDAATATPTSSVTGLCVTNGRLNVSGF